MFKQINSIIQEAETTEGTEAKDEAVDLDEKDGKAVSDVLESEIKVADVEKSNKDGDTTSVEQELILTETVEAETVGTNDIVIIDKEPEDKDYSYLLSENNSAYKLLSGNEELFKKAKRTSKLVKDIAKLIEGRVSLAEAGSFFAECGRAVSNNYVKEGLILAKENNFPIEVTDFIKEHNFKLGYPRSKETAITMIVCKLNQTIDFLDGKGLKRSVTAIVDSVMDSCLMAGRLDASGLSLNEYKFIKDYLLEEARVSYDYFSGERS